MTGSPPALVGRSARLSFVARPTALLRMLASFHSGTKLSFSKRLLRVAARLRRLTNATVAAAIARHAQASAAHHRTELLHLRSEAIHHGPLDQLLAWAAARIFNRPKLRS